MSAKEQKNNEEEIDLGSLFIIIGKGFSKLFNFIGGLFKGGFHGFISILLFLKKNFIKIAIAGVIGLVIGIFLESKKEVSYKSELLVEPNFNSTRQLYTNIDYYNSLIEQKDTVAIQKTFHLDKEAAGSLYEFTIEPVKKDSDILEAYNELALSVDTLAIKNYKYEMFKKTFTDYDYQVYTITVKAQKDDVFAKLGNVIISSIKKNEYFNRTKKILDKNLHRTDSLYRENLSQIDSLRKVYMKVMVEESKRQSNGGTNIDLGGAKKETKELKLFETSRGINEKLNSIAEEKSKKYEIINVISDFQSRGIEIGGVTKNYAFLLAVFGVISMILLLLLLRLNKYLSTYKK